MTADSLGRRASNSSATRGRPPVMSRVLALSVGMRAMTSRRLHLGARIDRDDGVDRQHVAGVAAAAELEDLAVLALDHQRRTQVLLAAGGAGAPVDDHALGDAGRFVERLGHRLTFDQVLEADRALDLGEDRAGVRIPLGDALAALDVLAVLDLEPRAVLDAVHGALGAVRIGDGDDQVAAHRDQIAVRIAGDVHVLDLDGALEVRTRRTTAPRSAPRRRCGTCAW